MLLNRDCTVMCYKNRSFEKLSLVKVVLLIWYSKQKSQTSEWWTNFWHKKWLEKKIDDFWARCHNHKEIVSVH